ncbi:MAG: hypothetical protein LBI53_00785 [Candidatus Peribacteria bacterium]|jgi:hypothetical protein|nr:hypothetical protein [Candidatus Peribacteria bacterium]
MSSSTQDENILNNQPIFSEPANIFQPTAQVGDLAQETLKSSTEIVGSITDIGSNIIGSVGEIMAEPANLFQPTKSISML